MAGAAPVAPAIVVPGAGWTLVTARSAVPLRDRERRVLQALADLVGRLLEGRPAADSGANASGGTPRLPMVYISPRPQCCLLE
jgi:hypothetical protein